ncbi:hypothetical protein BC629DRAFT_1043000 [Irpex lacteus]|nr:hypothetical protein BC629DRAFT_1043000 [Irpex lacteus]
MPHHASWRHANLLPAVGCQVFVKLIHVVRGALTSVVVALRSFGQLSQRAWRTRTRRCLVESVNRTSSSLGLAKQTYQSAEGRFLLREPGDVSLFHRQRVIGERTALYPYHPLSVPRAKVRFSRGRQYNIQERVSSRVFHLTNSSGPNNTLNHNTLSRNFHVASAHSMVKHCIADSPTLPAATAILIATTVAVIFTTLVATLFAAM